MHGIVGGIDLRQQRIVVREAGGAHPLAQLEEIAELRADGLADGAGLFAGERIEQRYFGWRSGSRFCRTVKIGHSERPWPRMVYL